MIGILFVGTSCVDIYSTGTSCTGTNLTDLYRPRAGAHCPAKQVTGGPLSDAVFSSCFFYVSRFIKGGCSGNRAMINMISYTSLLYNTTPIRCTPPPTAPLPNEYPTSPVFVSSIY